VPGGRGGGAMSAEPSSGAAATPNGGEPTAAGTAPSPGVAEPAPSGAQPSSNTLVQPAPGGAEPASSGARVSGRVMVLRAIGGLGAVLGYGCLAAFLYLIGRQIYGWFREGEWSHFGVAEGLRVGLTRCCVNDGDSGRLAALVHWIEAPVDWLGLHKVLEILPASLALFALSILGNSIFIYCRDRSDARLRAQTD
jgi:hypothetical protein